MLKTVMQSEFFDTVNVNGGFKTQNIGEVTETRNLAATDSGEQGRVPELLSGVNVREVDFDRGHGHGNNGIAKSHRGVSVSGGVEDDDISGAFGLLNPIDQFTFIVGLPEFDLGSEFPGALSDQGLDFGEGLSSVFVRLTSAQKVEVWAVEEEDFHVFWTGG